MKNKLNFTVDKVIQNNLDMPSNQKLLSQNFKIFKFNYQTITSQKFLEAHNNWPEDQKEKFYKIIGGKIFFKQVKNLYANKFMENKI